MGRTWGKETFLRKCLKAGVSNSESYVENISAEDFQPSREHPLNGSFCVEEVDF